MNETERERLRERAKRLREMGVLPRGKPAPTFDPKGSELLFQFENAEAANHFKTWMAEMGEQDYWQWMEIRETEEDGPITGIVFEYHKNREIPVKCGRFEDDT